MHFQSMIERKFLLLVDNVLGTREIFPSKILVTIRCNLYCPILSSMASSIFLRTKDYPNLYTLKFSFLLINRTSIKFMILRMYFAILLSTICTLNRFLIYSEKSSSCRILWNTRKRFSLFNPVLPIDLNRSLR